MDQLLSCKTVSVSENKVQPEEGRNSQKNQKLFLKAACEKLLNCPTKTTKILNYENSPFTKLSNSRSVNKPVRHTLGQGEVTNKV